MRHLLSPIFAVCTAFLFVSASMYGQTTLTAGDIAIIAQNTDDPDQFVFVTLVDLQPGTSITFTDNGWNGSALTTNEGTFVWTTSTLRPRGTVISVLPTGISFSTSGDNLFAYQGAASSPNFIFGFANRPWVTGSISASTSRRPSSLTVGSTALSFSTEVDNGFYNQVSTSGTKAQILSSICTTTKWTRSNNRYSSFPNWSFSFPEVITEPVANPSNFVSSNITTYSANISFSAASPAPNGYIVIRSEDIAPNSAPVDGVTYTVGQSIGNAKVIGIGNTLSYSLKALRAQKTYHFAVYAYLNSGAINYRQEAPLVASFSTPASMIGNYYVGISDTALTFIDDLKNRIRNPYVNTDYALYDENIVAEFEATDTTNGQKNISCAYSGFKFTYTPPFVWHTASPFSREHTWAVSWMPTGGSTSSNEYEDYHNLFTVVQNNANAVRSNYPLGDVVTPTSVYLNGQLGFNAEGQRVYEPRDEQKGNAARALFYMALRYDGLNGADWSFDYLNNVDLIPSGLDPQSVETLINWHFQDAPDAYDISRNDYIQSKQGNRNPFIDQPEWVNAIDFYQLTLKTTRAETAPIPAQKRPQATVYPNPTSHMLHIVFADHFAYSIVDLTGKEMFAGQHTGSEVATIDVNQLASGTYILVLSDGKELIYNRFVRE